jgi:type IV pilus assembly protein PilC
MDATGMEIRDTIDAPTEEEAQSRIRQMGYFVTKITNAEYRPKPIQERNRTSEERTAQLQRLKTTASLLAVFFAGFVLGILVCSVLK